MQRAAYVPGIYPRSEALVQATRDLDRGRTTAEAVEAERRRDEASFARVQEEAGLALLADGMLAWQDLFRPLVEAAGGLAAGPLRRFLDTNTFYRAVVVGGRPRLAQPLPAPDLPSGRWLATLPSPLAFARATGGAVPAQELAAAVLAPQVEAYAGAGCALVVLSDPFLAGDASLFERGVVELEAALRELPSISLALQLPFADASPYLARLADLPVEAIGVDFYATPLEGVPEAYPKEIMAGVVDARSSALEDPGEIATFVEELVGRRPAGVSLSQNGDLQFVPEPIARRKVAVLGKARSPLEAVA